HLAARLRCARGGAPRGPGHQRGEGRRPEPGEAAEAAASPLPATDEARAAAEVARIASAIAVAAADHRQAPGGVISPSAARSVPTSHPAERMAVTTTTIQPSADSPCSPR